MVRAHNFQWKSLHELMKAETVFLAVPIRVMPELLLEVADMTRPQQLFIDVASVKTQVRDWMVELLPESVQILNTHPMFGPDSFAVDPNRNLVFCPTRIEAASAQLWRDIFSDMGCTLREMEPELHDRMAARTQGITHYMGRAMQAMGIERTELDTHGFRQVHAVVEQTCEDSEDLFIDLQSHNPHTWEMIQDFHHALDAVEDRIHRDRRTIRIGYQGIPGSFSDEATQRFVRSQGFEDVITEPLVSSLGVINGLGRQDIDYGIIAMENARGGVVMESIHALAATRCKVLDMFRIQVVQCLLGRQGDSIAGITSIHSHGQALRQCSGYLTESFSKIPQVRAEDTALAARLLSENQLPPGAAVIAPARSAELYGLDILERGIQDLEENPTLFLVLARPGGKQLHRPVDEPDFS
jgi:prephenate dehydratase/prephenate dehydrogenase